MCRNGAIVQREDTAFASQKSGFESPWFHHVKLVMADEITKTVRKYRKQFPSLKVYICYDPASWDATKAVKVSGEVRVQVCLNDVYGARIYEKKMRPKSDKTIAEMVDRMCRKAFRNHLRSLKQDLKKIRGESSEARGKVVEIRSKTRDIQTQIKQLSNTLRHAS